MTLIGKTFGKYRIVEQIGRGGMAEVYKAYHPGLDRYVAVKLMHYFLADEKGFLERFQREARSVARLRHPNIVQMYDFDIEGDVSYMVMEFLQGPSLKKKLAELEDQGQWLMLGQAVCIVRDVGEALDYAHRQRMFHRDVKPANIMLTKDGGAILTDFGIVKMIGAVTQLTASGAMVGTPAYMAPEQSMGAAGDERADIYSLGIVLYQLVTGQLPYDADTPMAIVLKHLSASLPIPSTLNPDLPEGIERVIFRALAKEPDDRYQSVREMLDHLDQAMQGRPIPEVDISITTASQPLMDVSTLATGDLSAPTQVAAAPRARQSTWWVAAAGLVGLAAIVLLIGGFMVLRGRGRKSTPTPTKVIAATISTKTPVGTSTPTHTPGPTNTPDLTATYERAIILTLIAPTSTETPTPTPTDTPLASATPTLTATPDAAATALVACVFDATLEKHVTIPLGRYFAPGATFEKTWRLFNSGDCAWQPGSMLAFVSGDQMGAEEHVEVEPIAPDTTTDVSVAMRAPSDDGNHAATWRLQMPDGELFGQEIIIQINVGPTPTPRPTFTPRPTATPLATATPTGPLEVSVPSILPGTCWLNPNTGRWGATLAWSAWGGTGIYEYYAEDIKPEFKLDSPAYNFSTQVDHRWPGALYTIDSSGTIVKVDRWVEPSECGY